MNKKLRLLICFALIVTISIPVISISLAEKPDKGPIEKKVFIHRIKPDKPVKPPKPNGKDKEWYKYSGIHWASEDLSVTYTVDTYGSDLDNAQAVSTIILSFETWDKETDTDVFGDYTATYDSSLIAGELDYVNAVVWGDYPTSGVIAMTYFWYYPDTGELVDVDTLFDTDYEWSISKKGIPGTMDLQNIATHEFGHWLVLDDLYNRPARKQTMYGYSTFGEISKRSLESGDIAGLEAIYGERARKSSFLLLVCSLQPRREWVWWRRECASAASAVEKAMNSSSAGDVGECTATIA